jgi:hypothetical protein
VLQYRYTSTVFNITFTEPVWLQNFLISTYENVLGRYRYRLCSRYGTFRYWISRIKSCLKCQDDPVVSFVRSMIISALKIRTFSWNNMLPSFPRPAEAMFYYEKALALGNIPVATTPQSQSFMIMLLSFCTESTSILDIVLTRMRIADCYISLGDYHNALKVPALFY